MKKIYMILAAITLLSMSLNAQTSVTVADGTSTSDGYQYMPVYGYYFERAQTNQMIYTASQLGLQVGDVITSLTFYPRDAINFTGGSVTLSLGNTSTSQFSSAAPLSGVSLTQVAQTTSYTMSNGGWTLNFSTPFTYLGENLLVQFSNASGTYGRTYFYGQDQSNYQSFCSYNSNRYYFLPKITLDYERSSDPMISANQSTVTLSSNPNTSVSQTVTVAGVNLTDGITASLNDPNNVFSLNTTSLGTNGGNLIVTYLPTATGTHTATITLTSSGASPVTISLTGNCINSTTLCEGTETNEYLPIYGYYYDTKQINQIIYPESMLTNLVGKQITSMTFYSPNIYCSEGAYSVKIGMTDQASFSTAARITTGLTPVASGLSITSGTTELTITFSEPFEYTGGNLLMDFEVTTVGEYGGYGNDTYFYGVTQTGGGFYSYGSTTNANGVYSTKSAVQNFLPKVTFTFMESTPPTPTPELTAPENGSTVNVGTNEGSGVSTTITVSGNDLTEDLTVSVSGTGFSVTPATISAADANAGTTVTVTYNGTDPNATGTLTISSSEVSTTVNLTASYVQVIPTVAISPATQTINDAAAGALTVTGTNIDGNINVSAANDWSLSSTSLSNTGGQVSVSYTGRALSANTTVTASATGATDATATVNYVADLYIVTDNGVTDQWDFNNGTHMTYDPNTGTYTATFTANADNTYILFARMLGNDVNWNTRYVFGPASDGNWWMTGESASGTIDVNDDDPIYFQNAGTYTITINSDGTFTITTGSTPQVPVLITPEDGSTVFVGTTSAELPTVSKEIPISGQYLTRDLTATISGEGFSFLTRDVTVPYADVNAATASVTVVYSGTNENATGTLTLSSDEVSATVNLTASYRKPEVLTDVPAGYVVMARKSPNGISTAVIELPIDLYHGEVVNVTYVNSLGMTSDTPFEGVNIVVTRYSDGTTSTSKVVK